MGTMAIPIITRVLPYGADVGDSVEGPTAGRSLVEIYGNNFKLPTVEPTGPQAPPFNGYVFAPRPTTVQVLFDGEPALDVRVISSIKIQCLTPISPITTSAPEDGSGLVDVTINNLDDNGDVIAGETVTLADGYKYAHPKLDVSNNSPLVRMVRELIQQLKRQVLPNVSLTTNTDYDSDLSTASIEIAKMPAIVLQGPEIPENRFYSLNEQIEEESNGTVRIRRRPRTVDLNFDLIGISDSTMELINLMSAVSDFVDRNQTIGIYCDPDQPQLGKAFFEFDYADGGGLAVGDRLNISNVRSFSGIVTIRGFDLNAFASFAGDHIVDLSVLNTEGVNLDVESFDSP